MQQVYVSGHELKDFNAFGVQLYPLTLGHIQLLAEMESAIPYPPAKVEVSDVYKLVSVVAYPNADNARDRLSADFSGWIDRISKMTDDENIAGISEVTAYIAYYLAKPLSKAQQIEYADTRAPWWWGHAEFLQSVLGRSEREAWNTLVVDAFAYFAAWSVRNGDEDLFTAREVEIHSMVKSGKTVDEIIKEANA